MYQNWKSLAYPARFVGVIVSMSRFGGWSNLLFSQCLPNSCMVGGDSFFDFLVQKLGVKLLSGLQPVLLIHGRFKIGNYSWIGDHVELYSLGEIEIGANSVISQKSYLCTGSHIFTKETFDIYERKISIENEVWIASDVFIAPGVTIKKGAVIGARSTVLNDMPEGMICYGYPAKPVKPRITE